MIYLGNGIKKNNELKSNVSDVNTSLEDKKADKIECKKTKKTIIDLGEFTGTVTSEGELDIDKFIENAMNLPTFKKKYKGIKLTR